MKKIFLSLTLAVLTLLVFAGCTPKTHKVTFKPNNGQSDVIKEVKHGQKVEKPNNPVNEGFVFQFWAENGKEFDFNTKIEKDHILTATWTEQTTGLKVVLPEGIKVTTPNVDLTNLNKGTKLDFEITVPNYHLVKSLLANTSDIIGNLKEGKKFSFTVNKNVTFKVTFDVLPEVKGELNTQLGKVTDIVVKKLETDPKLTLEQVKAKVAEKLDLTLVDLEVAQKDEKFVVTLTSKKVNTLKVEKEITVTYEKLDTHVVSANQNFTVLTPNVELNAVKHGTELEFQVVVPTGKVVDTLKANNKDIKATLTTDNKFKYIVNEDVTFEVTFKFDEAILNQEVEAELNKIENLAFDLVDDQQEKTEAELKALLETKVNTELVTLQLVKNTTDYTVTLTSKKLETVTKTKNITVTYNKFYSVTVPAEITVEGGQDLTKVPANTKLKFKIKLNENQIVETLLANEENILSLLNNDTFEYTIDKKLEFKITLKLNEELDNDLKKELDKIESQSFDLVDDQQEKTFEELKTLLTKLIDTSLVTLELTENSTNNYVVKLTSKKDTNFSKQKTITVTYKQFYSVNVPTEIKVEGEQVLTKVPANKELTFVVTIPENNKVTKLTANEESILNILNGNKFQYIVTKKVQFAVEFAEKQKFAVVLPEQIKTEQTIDLQQVLEGTKLTFVVTIPEYQVVDTLTANTNDIKDLLKGNKFEYTINEAVSFVITFAIDPEIQLEVSDELDLVEDDLKIVKLSSDPELTINELTLKIEEKVDTTLVTVILIKNESDYTVKFISKKVPSIFVEKNITINQVNGHKLTIDLDGGSYKGKTGVITIFVEENKKLENFSVEKPGYTFVGLYKGESYYDTNEIVTESLNLKVRWEDIFIKFEQDGKIFIQGVANEGTRNLYIPGMIDAKEVEILGKAFIDNSNILTVIIGEGVRRIGNMAFFNVRNLSSLTLPKTLEYIGNRAFYGTSIPKVTIPYNVNKIGYLAFAGTSLYDVEFENNNFFNFDKSAFQDTSYYRNKTLVNERFHVINSTLVEVLKLDTESEIPNEINLPVGLKAIGNKAFYNFKKLTKLSNTDQLVHIGNEAFYGAEQLRTFNFSNNLKFIGDSAFEKATNLLVVNFNEGLEYIGEYAFSKTSLQSIKFPSTLKEISDFAFLKTRTLENVVFNDKIEKIGDSAFKDTKWLDTEKEKGLVIANNILINADAFTESTKFPENVIRIAGGAFYSVQISELTIPRTVKYIDKHAIKSMKRMQTLNLSGLTNLENFAITYDGDNGLTININSVSELPSTWPVKWITINSYPEKLKINWAKEIEITFNLNGAESSSIPSQTILQGQTINLPESPRKTNHLFVGWKTKSGEILTENTQLYETQELVAQWVVENDIFNFIVDNFEATILGLKDSSHEEIEIPAMLGEYKVIRIAANAFKDQTNLRKITIPNTVKEIGENAFENTGLIEVTIPNSVIKLNDNLFLNSNKLEIINLPENLKEFGENVFEGTKWIENQRLNNNNLVIVNEILIDAKHTTNNVVVPENVKVINSNSFKTTQATSIKFSEGLTLIKSNALSQTSTVTEIIIPRSVEVIEANAFNVETLTIKIPSRYTHPETYQENWDKSINGTHNVLYKQNKEFIVNIKGNYKLITEDINLQAIPGGTVVEIQLIPDNNFVVSKLTINNQDKTDILDKETNIFKLLVEDNFEISFEQIKDPIIEQEIVEEKNKLINTPIYIGSNMTEENYPVLDLIKHQASMVLDKSKVDFKVSQGEFIENKQHYVIKLISKKDSTVTENISFPLVLIECDPENISTEATTESNKWSGGSLNNYYGAPKLIDHKNEEGFPPALHTKWRSPKGVGLERRFIVLKSNKTIDLKLIWLNFEPGTETEPEYKIYVADTLNANFPESSNWKEVAHVVTEPNSLNSSVSFPKGTTANYIKLVILRGNPKQEIDSVNSYSIAHLGIYGIPEKVEINIDLNGGNINGDITNKQIIIDKGDLFDANKLSNLRKENYVLDYFEKDGEKFYFTNTPITSNINLKVIWKVDPNLNEVVKQELDKVKNKFTVETNDEITDELVINKVKTYVDNNLVEVEISSKNDNKYTILIRHNKINTVTSSKEVIVLKRNVGETVELIFNLNGGTISNSTENIIVNVLKGELIGNLLPQNPEKQYYNFNGWLNSENQIFDFENIEIYEPKTFTAKFTIKPEVAGGVNEQLDKISDEIGLEGTIDLESVKTHLETIVDTTKYSVVVEAASTLNKTHKVTIISKEIESIKNSKEIYVNKPVVVNYPENIKIDGKTSPQTFVLGTTKKLTIEIEGSKVVKELIINGINVVNELQNNSYDLIIQENLEISVVYETNPDILNNLQKEINRINDSLYIKKIRINYNDVLTEIKNILENQSTYTIDLKNILDNKYKVELTSTIDKTIKVSKEFDVYRVGSLNEYLNKNMGPLDYSSYNGKHKPSDAFDLLFTKKPRLTSKWEAKEGQTHFIILTLDKARLITGFELSNAGVKESQKYNTKSFKLWASNDKNGQFIEIYSNDSNTQKVVLEDLNLTQEYKFIKLEILQGEQNGHVARIYDITLFGVMD